MIDPDDRQERRTWSKLQPSVSEGGDTMLEDQTKALAALSQAMAIEQEGIDFYSGAAEGAQDEQAGQTLLRLARDEKSHLTLLKRQYDSLSREGVWQDLPEVKPAASASNGPIIFPRKQAQKAPPSGSSTADVLLFGMDIETRSYDLYRQAASTMADPRGQAMYQFLVAEETRHFDLLMSKYEQIAGPTAWQY
jgi:rubrerythrin